MCLLNFNFNYVRHFLKLSKKDKTKENHYLSCFVWLLAMIQFFRCDIGHSLSLSIKHHYFVCVPKWRGHIEPPLRKCSAVYLEWTPEGTTRLRWQRKRGTGNYREQCVSVPGLAPKHSATDRLLIPQWRMEESNVLGGQGICSECTRLWLRVLRWR